jgi:hypothetical protein
LSRIGVEPLTESMIVRSGEKRVCGRGAAAPVLFAGESSYAPQSPPVSHDPVPIRATASFTRAARGPAVLTSSRLAPISSAPAWAKWV